jgi:hypothetical protein
VRRIYFEGLLNLGLSKTYKWKKNCGAPCQKRTAKALRLDLFAGGRKIFVVRQEIKRTANKIFVVHFS